MKRALIIALLFGVACASGRDRLPVVFIHGNGGNAAQWHAQVEHLGKQRRAIAIDLPGFGQTPAPKGFDFSLQSMADAVDSAIDRLGVRRFVIVGHSYAGAVVAKYAADHPEKVAGVVYVDSAAAQVSLNDKQKEQLRAAFAADKMRVVRTWFAPLLKPSSEPVRQLVLDSVEKTPVESFTAAFLSLTAFDAKTLVNAYHGPRLAIAAADLESPASFQKVFPDIECVRIAGAGHWIMLDKPDEVNRALDAFLGRLEARATP
jgi:pimeloyl-ACP methyl ester carboxylesterase